MSKSKAERRDFLKMAGALGLAFGTPVRNAQTKGEAKRRSAFDVTAFGAQGDGTTLDTAAINRAIAAAAEGGRGTVVFPAGTYLSYSIHLKSNVALELAQGATILAADSPREPSNNAYDPAESNAPWESYQDFGHNHWHNSLLWGEGLENIALLGPGRIWGRGLSRGWQNEEPKAERQGVGNKAIALKNCRNVTLRDFSILHGGHFGILATGVDNLTIDNLKIDTNRDGMDIDCCRNVRVSNCSVNSPWDDGICLKSSFALGHAQATEQVTITNCLVSGSFEEGTLLDGTFKRFPADAKVSRTGRIKFGTESNGGFKGITISNCIFDGCHGLALESVDGAVLEDVAVTNITMRDIRSAPIFMRLGSRMRGPSGASIGAIRRVLISNVVCSNAASKVCSLLTGIPGHELEEVKLSNILIEHRGGGTTADAALEVPENERDYPEPTRFGTMPAQGFFLRHMRGIELSGVKIVSQSEDHRPAFVLSDVQHADFSHIHAPQAADTRTILLKDVRDFALSGSYPLADTHLEKAPRQEL